MSVASPDYAGFADALADCLRETAGTPLQLRDEGVLRSAFARPENLAASGGSTDPCAAAASLAFGVARNPPLADGNKRAAGLALLATLLLNGLRLDVSQRAFLETILKLADGALSEAELAAWTRANTLEDQRFLDRDER